VSLKKARNIFGRGQGIPVPDALVLEFSDFNEGVVPDYTSLADWNTAFLPTTPFSAIQVDGFQITLTGGEDVTQSPFTGSATLLKILDYHGSIVTMYAFGFAANCTGLTTVVLSGFQTTGIWVQAFEGCTALTSVTMPLAYELADRIFKGCTSLVNISLPACINLGASIFEGCTLLNNVSIPLLGSMGALTFKDCPALTAISLPILVGVGNSGFENCTSLASVNLPLMASFPQSFFRNCTSLVTISLPSTSAVGNNGFRDCTNLVSVTLGGLGNGNLGTFAFASCTSLTTVTRNSSTGLVGQNCFNGCSALVNISLPGVTLVGQQCFINCTLLQTVNLPNVLTVSSAPSNCFSGCPALHTVLLPACTALGATTGDDSVFIGCTGKNPFNLTITAGRMTANGGLPDGDIQYLQANNVSFNITQT
jgi:hypothetical protein